MSQTDTSVNERLAAITAAGTSVWLDQISRGLIETGELESMVHEYSLRGLTSNPAIFEKAIVGAEEYDGQIAQLVKQGADARAIYQAVAIRDVQDAADILRPVYDESGGTDGFVSFEVDPDLAADSDKTIEQARDYWQRVDRPNLMIKIPGTPEGLGPIETAISEGINVNVTLLFSVEAYATVAEAFIKGLEKRHAAGESLDIQSVASFFVSRVDTEVDKRLEALDKAELKGKAGLANARAAYAKYQEIFHGERFAELKAAGAPVQRPLWASTGTKNPDYPDTLYVDGLVGPETVNTMPMATLKAAADHAEVDPSAPTVEIDPAHDLLALGGAGIDMKDVTDQLLQDGITAFVTPMESLLASIEEKLSA
jgi:transaldolase